MRLGGQLRLISGMSGVRAIGFDMNVAFSMADALGADRAAVAEFLPHIEVVAIPLMNQSAGDQE